MAKETAPTLSRSTEFDRAIDRALDPLSEDTPLYRRKVVSGEAPLVTKRGSKVVITDKAA